MDPIIGQVVAGRYEVIRLIGKGGMGEIYELRHQKLGRKFALKTLSAELAKDAEALARFQREADVVAKLHHKNIVDIIDWDTLEDGAPCIVMEHLRGEDLAQRIKRDTQVSWPDIATIADRILSALTVAHREGIVHRDLKPQNIFLATDDSGEEQPKLLDFGVSKVRHSGTFATTDAKLLGTPAYMAPEQADGRHEDVGPHTDVWAMGAILFEMATGKLAFFARSVPSILYAICHKRPDPLRKHRADTPAAFADLVDRALCRDDDRRLRSVEQMRLELREALSDVAGVFAVPGHVGLQPSAPMRLPSVFETQDTEDAATPVPATPVTEMATANTIDDGAPPVMATTLSGGAAESVSRGRAPRTLASNRGPWLFGGAAAVTAAVVAIVLFGSSEPTQTTAVAALSDAATAPDAQPDPAAATPDPAAATDPGAAPAAPDAAPPAAGAIEQVTLTVVTKPVGARVYRDDKAVGRTPYELTEKRDPGGVATLEIKLEGYHSKTVKLPLDGDMERSLQLEPRPHRTKTRTKTPAPDSEKAKERLKNKTHDPFKTEP